jgi:hypothetical protein
MEKVYNSQGTLIFQVDDEFLYYRSQIDSNEIFPDDSIPLSQLDIDNNGPFKLLTLLQFLKETEVIDSVDESINDILRDSQTLGKLIKKYQEQISVFDNRVVLYESESSGPGSSSTNILYLMRVGELLHLFSSVNPHLSPSEIIEIYGFGENEFWGEIQADGEFIEWQSLNISAAKTLVLMIHECLTATKQWGLKSEEIHWKLILERMQANEDYSELALDLMLIIYN